MSMIGYLAEIVVALVDENRANGKIVVTLNP